ncbi:MAG: outer membrane lipoprotein chaperone LolA, partial [Porticoccaceae bacterium]|nr:outer membrane lipoprotein chaperone LolA [Porticoccaceae bacterium]
MIKSLIALILFCHICLAQVAADDLNEPEKNAAEINAVLELKKLLEPLSSVSADFHQQLYSADDYQIQDNTGHMQVSAPGKIRWIIDSPMEQWLISDGLTLWLYDPDLEQVIIKPFDPRVSAAPALLLTGSVGELS